MTQGAQEKLVISTEELADPSVDEVLTRQLSFGMAGPPEKVADKKTGLLYRAWFALMLAGGLGALVGWGIIEPFFHDGIQLQGHIEANDGISQAVRGWGPGTIVVGGRTVWLDNEVAFVDRDGAPRSIDGLSIGQVVEVIGQPVVDAQGVFATRIELLGERGEVEPASDRAISVRRMLLGLFIFPLIASLVGLFIGAADGLLSRALRRAGLCGLVGLGMGLAVGSVASLLAGIVYALGSMLVQSIDGPEPGYSVPALIAQMISRGLAWAVAGAAMGLGQGVAMRSKKMLINGLLGGVVGSLIGGLLFDPIDLLLGSAATGQAEVSRAVGFVIIGMTTGLMIGVVELLAREAWIKMLTGPLAGKELVLYKDPTTIGSSPKADVYLFKDPEVEPNHALIRALGEGYEVEDSGSPAGVFVNGRRLARSRLESGDQVRIGKTVFSFSIKEG